MKARLLFEDRDSDWQWAVKATLLREAKRVSRRVHDLDDFHPERALPWNHVELVHDLGLEALFSAMAGDEGDDIYVAAQHEMLNGPANDAATLRYRQAILADALAHREAVRELHGIAVEAVDAQRRHYLGTLLSGHPDSVLRWAIDALRALLVSIRKLRRWADRYGSGFAAPGWQRLIETIQTQLSSDYIAEVEQDIGRLDQREAILLSASPGEGNRPQAFRLHRPPDARWTWWQGLLRQWLPFLFAHEFGEFSFSVAPRDESGARALRAYTNRGLAIAARSLGVATGHIRDFFAMLRAETAFYVGAIRLAEQLDEVGVPVCMPSIATAERALDVEALAEPGLALRMRQSVVTNDLQADGASLIVITGANQGGKSTLLRAIGVGQMMAACGLFVTAKRFSTSLAPAILTHYKREEDATLVSGKFDEELARMSRLVDQFRRGALVLLNESFAATSEREASEIADDIVESFRAAGGRVIFVTHLFEYAGRVADRSDDQRLMLRADRSDDGGRSFKILPGNPLQTSFGEDLFQSIFERPPVRSVASQKARRPADAA